MDKTIDVAELDRARESGDSFTLLDVRRQADFDADDVMIPGARHADPERIDEWISTLDPEQPLVVYCVKGGWVSESVNASLIERGFDARYVEGGINKWKARGGIGVPKVP